MGEDVAGCEAGCVLAVGEDAAGCSEGLGALSEGLLSKGTSSDGLCAPPGCSSSAPISSASFSFALPSDDQTDSLLKAAPRPSRESSSSPLKGTEGTGSSGSGSPSRLVIGAGLAGATEEAVVLAVSLVSMFFKAWRSPAEKHNHCSLYEVSQRTAATYSLSLQEIGAKAVLGTTIGYRSRDLDLCVG